MTHAAGDSELEEAQRLIGREVEAYLAEDHHWHEAANTRPAGHRARWPRDVVLWWKLSSAAMDHAWNLGRIMSGLSIEEADDESDPRSRRLQHVAKAAAAHAMEACRKHFGSASYLAGAERAGIAEKAREVDAGVRAGMSVRDAARAAGVSRAQAYRYLGTKPR